MWQKIEDRGIISINNSYYQYWKYLLTILSVSSSMFYGGFAAFRYDVNYDTYEEYMEAA